MLDFGIEIDIPDKVNFNQIVETLTRIGIESKNEKKLTQSAHILNKRGKYYIISFKTMFYLDGKKNDLDDIDKKRVITIAKLLEKWKLVNIVDKEFKKDKLYLNLIKIISFKEKNEWKLISKYSFKKRLDNMEEYDR